jgi:hypothetical protein
MCFASCNLIRLHYRFRFETPKADEDVDHPAICDAEFVIYGIELRIETHPLGAIGTIGPVLALQEIRIATELVPMSDFLRCSFEFRKLARRLVQGMRNQSEWRNYFH